MSKRLAVILGLIFFGIVILTTFSIVSKRIPKNDTNATGNTAGNLRNKGLFCEDDGIVYFNNPYDGGNMYSMHPDETNIKKVLNYNVLYINAEGKYLYFYQDSDKQSANMAFGGHMVGVYRSKKNGENVTSIKKEPSGILSLVGNYIYYQHYNNEEGMTLYKSGIDKKFERQVADFIIDPASVQDGNIYFNGTLDNHYLFCLDTTTDMLSTVYKGNVWAPTAFHDYVYYMNVADDYRLYRYKMNSGEIEKLTNDRVDTYNVTENYIFYQKNSQDAPSIRRMRLDGSEEEEIMAGNFENINTTSQYVYFNEFDKPTPVYRTPIQGAVDVQPFDEASKHVK